MFLIILGCRNGTGEFEKLCDIIKEIPEIEKIQATFDPNQGSFENYLELVENIRRAFPTKDVIVEGAYNALEPRNYARGTQNNPPIHVAVPVENNPNPNVRPIDMNEGNLTTKIFRKVKMSIMFSLKTCTTALI